MGNGLTKPGRIYTPPQFFLAWVRRDFRGGGAHVRVRLLDANVGD